MGGLSTFPRERAVLIHFCMTEQELFDEVAQELREGRIHEGLWTRAFAEAGGLRDLAQAIYIRLRVSQLAELQSSQTRAAEQVRIVENRRKTRDSFKSVACEVVRNLCWTGSIVGALMALGMFSGNEGHSAIITLFFSVALGIGARAASRKAIEIKNQSCK